MFKAVAHQAAEPFSLEASLCNLKGCAMRDQRCANHSSRFQGRPR